MTGIRARVLAAKRKREEQKVDKGIGILKTGLILVCGFVWGFGIGHHVTMKALSHIHIQYMQGPKYSLLSQGPEVPVESVRCEGSCSVMRRGSQLDFMPILPQCDSDPNPENPLYRKTGEAK